MAAAGAAIGRFAPDADLTRDAMTLYEAKTVYEDLLFLRQSWELQLRSHVRCDALSRGERGGEKLHVGSRIRMNEPFRNRGVTNLGSRPPRARVVISHPAISLA